MKIYYGHSAVSLSLERILNIITKGTQAPFFANNAQVEPTWWHSTNPYHDRVPVKAPVSQQTISSSVLGSCRPETATTTPLMPCARASIVISVHCIARRLSIVPEIRVRLTGHGCRFPRPGCQRDQLRCVLPGFNNSCIRKVSVEY
jgi:hypothetical protein